MSEGREKVLMGLERSLKNPEDAIDVMAQSKTTSGGHFSSRHKRQKVQGDGEGPKREEKKPKAEVWIRRLSNF
jgi:hypothetical protein